MAPFDVWPAGILSIAGFSIFVCGYSERAASFKLIFIRSLSYGLGLYSIGASWIFVSIHNYGQANIGLSLLIITSFIILLSLLLAIPFAQCRKAIHTSSISCNTPYTLVITVLLIFPSLWTLCEWLRGWAFTGFPWLYLGYAHTDSWISGWAPITGVLGLSWITAFCGGLIGLAFRLRLQLIAKSTQIQSVFISLTGALALTSFFWLGGLYLQSVKWTEPSDKIISIGLMQPAISLWNSWDSSQLDKILFQYFEDTESLLGNDLVVWPEAAIPSFRHEVTDYLNSIAKKATNTNTTLIIGLPTASHPKDNLDTKNEAYYYNSALAVGQGTGIYHKQHLVPFGEYVPFEKWLRGIIRFFDLPMSVFSSGPPNQKNIIVGNDVIISTSICYEIAYSELVRKSAENANLLLTMSNDSWFGDTIGPKQHFQIARMRAIENRKPLIRATNNGISGLINADGKIAATIPSFYRDTLEGTLQPTNGLTPFGRLGSNPIIFISFLLIALGLAKAAIAKKMSI
jgi:apolipoprotein N-acyltransferase